MVSDPVGRTSRAATGTAGSKHSIRTLRSPPGDALSAFRPHRASGGATRPEAGQRGCRKQPLAVSRKCRLEAEVRFCNVDRLAMRAGLNEHELRLLASREGCPRCARGDTVGKPPCGRRPQRPGAGMHCNQPRFKQCYPAAAVAGPRRSLPTMPISASPRRVIAGLLRSNCALRFMSARELLDCPDRNSNRRAGIVTCRQRPAPPKARCSITLEDERPRQHHRQARTARTSAQDAARCPLAGCFRPDQSPGTSEF